MATCLIAILESFSNYTITGNNNDFQISYRSILTRMLYDFSSRNNFPSYKLSYTNFRDRSYFYNTISYRNQKIIFVALLFLFLLHSTYCLLDFVTELIIFFTLIYIPW